MDGLPDQVLTLAGHQIPAIPTPDRGGQESLQGKLGLLEAMLSMMAGSSQAEWARLHTYPCLQPSEVPSTAPSPTSHPCDFVINTGRQEKLLQSIPWGRGYSLAVPAPCPPSSQGLQGGMGWQVPHPCHLFLSLSHHLSSVTTGKPFWALAKRLKLKEHIPSPRSCVCLSLLPLSVVPCI